MIDLTHNEAILFRILSDFFGKDRVIPQMSVISVCGGALPESLDGDRESLLKWAKTNKCLFTVVDNEDLPKLIVEFFSGFKGAIDPIEVEHERFLRPILSAAQICYITISEDEFKEIVAGPTSFDFCTFLKAKIEDAQP